MEVNVDKTSIENFVIENNIIKGVRRDLPESYQIGKLLFDVFDSKPDHVSQIQVETEEQTTFAEMKEKSVRCALWLEKQGIGSNDIITIFCENHLDAYIPVFATFYLGAIHNAWNENFSFKELRHFMRTLQPAIIFVTEKLASVVIEAGKIEDYQGKIVAYDNYPGLQSLKVLMQQQTNEEVKNFQPRTLTNPEDLAHIVLTSGTTGPPKAVTHSYSNVVHHIFAATAIPKSVLLTYASWYWIGGFVSIMNNIFSRGTRILHHDFDPEETCKVMEKYKVEIVRLAATGVYLYCKLDSLKKYQLKSLKLVTMAGCKIPNHMLDRLRKLLPHAVVVNVLGTTEAGLVAVQTKNCKATDSSGFVVPGTEVKICDLKTNKALGPNKTGELYVKSPARSKGYYKNEVATKAAFDDEGWYHTGDLAYYDENGELFIVDRLSEVINYRNHQVLPNEIETILLSHPGVMEASVVPIPHEEDGERAMAFVKKSPGSQVTEEELVKLSESLGETKKLHGGVKFIDEIRKIGSSSKVARQILKELAKTMGE